MKNTAQQFRATILTLAALAMASLVLTTASANAAVVMGVTVEDFSSQLDASFNRLASMTIDGSGGVPVNSFTGSHIAGGADGTMWLSADSGCCGGTPVGGDPHVVDGADPRLAHIVWDLGAVYDVSAFRVWNYNESTGGGNTDRGAKAVTVTTSATDTLTGINTAGGTVLGGVPDFAEATGANGYTGQLFNNAFTGRYVRFDVLSTYTGDNQFAGLSEIRFDGELTPPATPEPASAMLLALGLVLGIATGRRRRNR